MGGRDASRPYDRVVKIREIDQSDELDGWCLVMMELGFVGGGVVDVRDEF